MSPLRAGAAVPNALSFSRTAMRELVRGRYVLDKLRFDLDSEGRGEVLYRLTGGGWAFHFFLVSTKLPEEQKTDRNFAQSWDAMGVLCQGEWTADREAHLRREVPKQRSGYADYDTLIYARGNRSARLFDHVVDRLAAGRQPDLALLAPVGYILRTTAFIGNGQLGTRPLAAYGNDHPLRRPYHAQFCSAFMLREYVFDLVDHLARARDPNAARLAPAYRRYLGLGNAAATGLVPFVVNHPHLMHRWCLAHETALARARHRPAAPHDGVVVAFGRLLDKAIQHLEESARPGDTIFATPQSIAAHLRQLREPFHEFVATGRIAGRPAPCPWTALADWADGRLHPEAVETLNAIVLELYPDIVEAAADDFQADERFDVEPAMTVARLAQVLQDDYGWALDAHYREEPAQHFWYRTTKAPRDVRRGLRGRDRSFEVETAMDTVLQVQRLAACLAQLRGDAQVADLVCARPDLRHIVARVQSLAGLQYAELREHWLSGGFSPFAPVRFALSFFGLEKFEAAMPKSVRGTFMQGAPTAEDVASGSDGDWPFPLMPKADTATDATALAPLPVCSSTDRRPQPVGVRIDTSLVIAPRELARMVQSALQGHGATLGVAEDASGLAVFGEACGEPAIAAVLQHCANAKVARDASIDVTFRDESRAVLDGHGLSALVAAPAAFDLAFACAHTSPHGTGVVTVKRIAGAWIVKELALRCARRRMIGLVLWQDARCNETRSCGFAVAAPTSSGPTYASASLHANAELHAALLGSGTTAAGHAAAMARLKPLADLTSDRFAAMIADLLVPARAPAAPMQAAFSIVCMSPRAELAPDALLPLTRIAPAAVAWTPDELRRRDDAWLQRGVALSRAQFDALNAAGMALLVPEAEEPRVLSEGADPLKVF